MTCDRRDARLRFGFYRVYARRLLPILLLLTLPAIVKAQFTFTTNNDGSLNIAGYTGQSGTVVIPSTTNGYPITGIVVTRSGGAFTFLTSLTNITIPYSVTNIMQEPFKGCINLTTITVDALNSSYSSVSGVFFDKSQTTLLEYPEGKVGSYIIPDSVTNIGTFAFDNCTRLTNIMIPNSVTSMGEFAFHSCVSLASVTIPNSVTSIGYCAFYGCNKLTGIYFRGNAPNVGDDVLDEYGPISFNLPIVYYLLGTTGWNFTFGNLPAVLWNPQAQTLDGSFSVQNNQFRFNIIGSSNLVIIVEAATNLADDSWISVGTNTLNTFIGTNGTSYFSDPQWTNYPSRFYRFRSP